MKKRRKNLFKLMWAAGAVAVSAAVFLLVILKPPEDEYRQRADIAASAELALNADKAEKEDLIRELDQIGEYLDQMEETVTANRDSLNLITGDNETFLNQYEILGQEIRRLEDRLQNFRISYEGGDEAVRTQLAVIEQALGKARSGLESSHAETRRLLSELEDSEQDRQKKLEKLLSVLKKEITEVKEQLEQSANDILAFLEELEEIRKTDREEEIIFMEYLHQEMMALASQNTSELLASLETEGSDIRILMEDKTLYLSGRMTDLSEQVHLTQEELELLLSELETEAEIGQEMIQESFESLQESLTGLRDYHTKTHKETKNLLQKAEELTVENQSELITVLERMDVKMDESSQTSLSRIMESLERMDQKNQEAFASLTEEMTDSFRSMDSSVTSQFAGLDTSVNNQLNNLDYTMGSRFNSLGDTVSNQFNNLDTTVNDQFSNLDSAVGSQFNSLGDAVSNQFNNHDTTVNDQFSNLDSAIGSQFSSLSDSVSKQLNNLDTTVNNQFGNLDSSMYSWFNSFDDTVSNQFNDLDTTVNNRFGGIDKSVNSQFSNLGDTVNNQFGSLGDTVDKKFSSLDSTVNNQFGSMDSKVSNRFNYLDSLINNQFTGFDQKTGSQFTSLETKFNSLISKLTTDMENQFSGMAGIVNMGDEGLRQFITDSLTESDNKMTDALTGVNQQLQSVFQYASSGKKRLASALLAKNVIIAEDATFSQFADAILSIQQQLVIGVEKLPGTISYDYHYHEGSTNIGDGCYSKAVYHAHTPVGGSCYTTVNSHCGCSNSVRVNVYACYKCGRISPHSHDGVDAFADGYVDPVVDQRCKNCGHGHHSGRTCGSVTGTQRVLNCSRGGTIESFSLGCGLLDGQITGAHIVYAQPSAAPGPLMLNTGNMITGADGNTGIAQEEVSSVDKIPETEPMEPPEAQELVESPEPPETDETAEPTPVPSLHETEEPAEWTESEKKEEEDVKPQPD